MKWCKFCEQEKPLSEFHNNKNATDGKNYRCILCVRARDKERREEQAVNLPLRRVCRTCQVEKDTFVDFPKSPNQYGGYATACRGCLSDASARQRWGIDGILKLVDEGYCEICHDKLQRNRYAVDHDHSCCSDRVKSCGRCIRGIICEDCNRGLGCFKDAPGRMLAAIEYLKKFESRA